MTGRPTDLIHPGSIESDLTFSKGGNHLSLFGWKGLEAI
jgi:hypothetical protein